MKVMQKGNVQMRVQAADEEKFIAKGYKSIGEVADGNAKCDLSNHIEAEVARQLADIPFGDIVEAAVERKMLEMQSTAQAEADKPEETCAAEQPKTLANHQPDAASTQDTAKMGGTGGKSTASSGKNGGGQK